MSNCIIQPLISYGIEPNARQSLIVSTSFGSYIDEPPYPSPLTHFSIGIFPIAEQYWVPIDGKYWAPVIWLANGDQLVACKDNSDLYPEVRNIKAPTEELVLAIARKMPQESLIGSMVIHHYLSTLDKEEVYKNGAWHRVRVIDLTIPEYQKPREDRVCPHCGAVGALVKHDNISHELTYHIEEDESGDFKPTFVKVILPVWHCPHCGATRREHDPLRFENTRLTESVTRKFASKFVVDHHKGSVRAAAMDCNLSDSSAAKILDYMAYDSPCAFATPLEGIERSRSNITQPTECNYNSPDKLITRMAIDEFAVRGREYICIVVDYEPRILHFYAAGNGSDTMHKLEAWSNGMIADNVAVTTDMNAAYMNTLRAYHPDLIGVYDRFHHESNAQERLEKEVHSLAHQLQENGREGDAKGLRAIPMYVLLAVDLTTLTSAQKAAFDKVMALHERIPLIREAFIELYKGFMSQNPEEAKGHMDQHILRCYQIEQQRLAASPDRIKPHTALSDYLIEQGLIDKPVPDPEASAPLTIRHAKYNKTGGAKRTGSYCSAATLANTTLKHLPELINYVKDKLTTSPLEGINNLAKVLKRASFGIKRRDRFMVRFKLVFERGFTVDDFFY